ncbi:MAG: HlyD family efflux transporter periplasmic adaptor subunit [Proteobacteria bacterium]|nr:HlyD family efflux transporter periplasmic adaptor subunit [Pseudomonadota bacterium]
MSDDSQSGTQSRIFRKVAFERLSSPDQIDSLMHVTAPRGWLALFAIAGLVLMALLWSWFSHMPVKVGGTGIILRGHGMQKIFSPVSGVLRELFVKSGEIVEAGQSVGFVIEGDSYRRIRELDGMIEARTKRISGVPAAERAALEAQNARDLQARADVEAAARTRGVIQAPYRAQVVEALVDRWDRVQVGDLVLYLEPTDRPQVALLYVSASDAGRVSPGMPVQLFPDSARREEYGCMLGRVEQINQYPSSVEDLRRKFGNDQLAAALLTARAPVQVTVSLTPDRSTPSGYAWSTRKGPPFDIRTGTLCTGSVVTGSRRPIDLVLP